MWLLLAAIDVAIAVARCLSMLGRMVIHGLLRLRCRRAAFSVGALAARPSYRLMRASVLLALGMGFLAACSTTNKPACESLPPQESGLTGYKLGSADEVQITVFRQDDMSGKFAIDGEGYLALPLVGEIKAGGLTTRQLENEIAIRLKADQYLVDPQVSVQLLTHRSIYVLGEVSKPGSYEYRDGMTVTNAVALAGGYTYRGNQSGITVDRGTCIVSSTRPDTEVLPGDIITIPERYF
jgi:protein involved in polysaccharide export with SLBB domain